MTHTETTPATAWTREYAYDARGRLENVVEDGVQIERYTYDDNGNRLTAETSTETITADYDDQDRLLTYGAFTYTYTANGELRTKTNTVTSEVTTYTYDARGNLTRVDLPDGTLIERPARSASGLESASVHPSHIQGRSATLRADPSCTAESKAATTGWVELHRHSALVEQMQMALGVARPAGSGSA